MMSLMMHREWDGNGALQIGSLKGIGSGSVPSVADFGPWNAGPFFLRLDRQDSARLTRPRTQGEVDAFIDGLLSRHGALINALAEK